MKQLAPIYKWITDSFSKNHIISLFRQKIWSCPPAIIILMFIIIGLLLFAFSRRKDVKANTREYFGSYANARLQGAIDILSINTLDPAYRINLIRELYIFENPAFRDAIESQSEEDKNPDDIVKTVKTILQSDLNNINDIGSECADCASKITDSLATLDSNRISSIDKLDIVKKINMYDPPRFVQIMEVSNYTTDSMGETQLADLIAYLRIAVSNPIADIPVESFSSIDPSSRPSNTKGNFEATCEILYNNSLSSTTKLDKIKDIYFFENPDYRSTIDNADPVTDSTVNSLKNIINNDLSYALDTFSYNKMVQALQMLNSNGLSPEEKINVLNVMDIYGTSDYIYIMNPINYSNDADAQITDIKAYLNCTSVRQIQQDDIAAAIAAAKKLAEEVAAAAKKAAEEAEAAKQAAEAAAKKAAEEAEAAKQAAEAAAKKAAEEAEAAKRAAEAAAKKAAEEAEAAKRAAEAAAKKAADDAAAAKRAAEAAAKKAADDAAAAKRAAEAAAKKAADDAAAETARLAAAETARLNQLAQEEATRQANLVAAGASGAANSVGSGASDAANSVGSGASSAANSVGSGASSAAKKTGKIF